MKQKLALAFISVLFSFAALAQNSKSNFRSEKKPALFGIHFSAADFTTPVTFKSQGVTPRNFAKLKDMAHGFSLSYWKGITPTIDFSGKLSSIFAEYASMRNESGNFKEFGLELEPSLNFRPIKDNNLFAPFLTTGIGAGYYTGDFGAYVPAGGGIQVNFNSMSYIMLQMQYRFTLTKDVMKDNMFYSLGFLQNFGPEKPAEVAPPPPPVVLDRDNDGIADADDKCPDVPGLASLQGCPDKDGDGIADADDKCPDVAGIAKYQGCPIPDTDGDGINDEEDKCPAVKGVARYQGCPIPDTDGDGINDEEDKCPTKPGVPENAGCPVIAKEVIEKINFAAKNVFFNSGSFKLMPKSYKSLNEVVNILKADESLFLDIDGHTDAQGADDKNQVLSENRAKAVKDYLVSKGVADSRLTSTGYGETKPVADNASAAGRAKNRRTEMTARNY
ncbi:MAG TPA: OmpA family protein [Ferruginibacter sp.]|nr:OmpA family protein [Ferruginibacter sp.]